MKKLMLLAVLMIMPMSAFADYFQVTVIDQCDGMDRIATYKFKHLARARVFQKALRNRTGVKSVTIKKVK